MELRLVKVKWNDAFGNKIDEVSLDDVATTHFPTQVETVGWLLWEDEVGISVVSERYNNVFRGRTFIPRGMIISVEDILPPKKTRKKKVNETLSTPQTTTDK